MRRISLALALIGAIAATGCGQSGSDDGTGGNPGIKEGTFTIVVQNGQAMVAGQPENPSLRIEGGRITSATSPALNCGGVAATACSVTVPNTAPVTLTAVPDTGLALLAWAGDCQGSETTCVLSGPSDKYIVAVFGAPGAVPHPNWTAAELHGKQYLDFALGAQGAWDCRTCHGAELLGQGIAVSCASCHTWPMGDHFRETAAFDSHGSGWSQGCQRCHTDQGFRDYIGVLAAPGEDPASDNRLDGTFNSTNPNTTNSVSAPTAIQYAWGPLKCGTCHNAQFATSNAVRFPSTGSFALLGATTNTTRIPNPLNLTVSFTVDSNTAMCAQCHQGRESTASVNHRIASSPTPANLDVVIGTGTFINPHYAGAAGTLFGTDAKMWAEYPNKIYTGRNAHGGKAACTDCHDAHTGKLPADGAALRQACGSCHFDEAGAPIDTFAELEEIRQYGFEGDINGDGVEQSLKHEIESLADDFLYPAIRAYATNVVGASACYDPNNHPYWFRDNGYDDGDATNGVGIADDGICQADERVDSNGAASGNPQQFNQFTPRLLRATFNYKWAHAEHGAWAHNPRYAIEILYDAITDLNAGLPVANRIAFAGKRSFNGHFGGAEDASPYSAWVYSSGAGFTSAPCYQCHGGEAGLAEYLAAPATGASLTMRAKVSGMECTTCHAPAAGDVDFTRIRSNITQVYFPPAKAATPDPAQVVITMPSGNALCSTCHSGRENGRSVVNAIATNYATSLTGLVATAGTTTSVTVTSPAAWALNRYKFAKVTFTTGALAGTTVIATASTASTVAAPASTISWAAALPSAPAAGDLVNLTFDNDTWGVGFTNPHYLGAAATLVGSNGHMMYEYPVDLAGQPREYFGFGAIWNTANNGAIPGPHGSPHGASCVACHQPVSSKHTFEIDLDTTVVEGTFYGQPNTQSCNGCHAGPYALAPLKEEVEHLADLLYVAIQDYARDAGYPVCYAGNHPYWFADTNGNGVCDVGVENVSANGAKLNHRAAAAAFNFKWAHAEPGGWAHNAEYVLQCLNDSIEDLTGLPVTGFTRP